MKKNIEGKEVKKQKYMNLFLFIIVSYLYILLFEVFVSLSFTGFTFLLGYFKLIRFILLCLLLIIPVGYFLSSLLFISFKGIFNNLMLVRDTKRGNKILKIILLFSLVTRIFYIWGSHNDIGQPIIFHILHTIVILLGLRYLFSITNHDYSSISDNRPSL